MDLINTLADARSRRILRQGESLVLGWYNYPNGCRWIARYKDRFYSIVHDGTANQAFCSHSPRELSLHEAVRRAAKAYDYCDVAWFFRSEDGKPMDEETWEEIVYG